MTRLDHDDGLDDQDDPAEFLDLADRAHEAEAGK